MIQKNRMNTRVLGTKLLFLAGIKNRLSQGEHHSAQYWTSDGSQGVLYYRNGFFAIRMEFIEAEGVLSFRAALYNIIFREDAKICQYEGDVSLIKNKSKKNIESHAKKLSEEFKKEISKRGLYIGALSFIGAEGETTLAGYKKFIPFGTQLREFSKGCLYLMVSLQRQWLLCPDDWRIQMTEGVRGDQLKIEVRVPPVGNLTKETLFESFVGVYNEGKTKLCGPCASVAEPDY